MSIFSDEKYEEKIKETTVLITKNCKDLARIERNLNALLKSGKGETLKEKKKYLIEQFIGCDISKPYLYKLINKAALEIQLLLEPGSLLEYHARRILCEKDPSNQNWIHTKAVALAGGNDLKSVHIEQAIDELKLSKKFTEEKIASSIKEKAAAKKKFSSKDTGNSAPKDKSQNGGESHLNDNDELSFKWESPVDIYDEIKPIIKSTNDKALLIKVINASTEFWKVLKILLNAKLSDKHAKELVDLIGPNNESQKGSTSIRSNIKSRKNSNSRNTPKNKLPGNSPRVQ